MNALPTRRSYRAFLTLLLFATMLTVVAPTQVVEAGVTPPSFVESVIGTGLQLPTNLEIASDGRIFVTEKRGTVQVFDNASDPTPTMVADLRDAVYNFWDRGLLGLALDPGFPSEPYLYLSYTHDFDPAVPGVVPRWGTSGVDSDPCPNPPGMNDAGCVVSGRISRITLAGNTMVPNSELVLIQDFCQQFPSHSLGDLVFGADGYLNASAGDGASFTFTDIGQNGNPVNPCNDPVNEGGSLRAQDLMTGGDPVTLDGTIIRIDPATGAAAPDNPRITSSDVNEQRIVAHGFRNPFRMTTRPGTNELWFGDVGLRTWEEINRLEDPTAAVANFGWPCYEGTGPLPSFQALGVPICQALYASPGAMTTAWFEYSHANNVVAGDGCDPGDSAPSGVAFYETGPYPDEYDGAMFFADYARSCIWVSFVDDEGLPDPTNISPFVTAAASPADLEISNGSLYYIGIIEGDLRRVDYTATSGAPIAEISADPASGAIPLTVNFDASGSSDPEPGDTLTFEWDLDGDGNFDDATGAQASTTYTSQGYFGASVRVTDSSGLFDIADVTIPAGVEVVPSPDGGGWQFNGAASQTATGAELTPNVTFAAGSAFWPTPVSTAGLSISFTATMDQGGGADGLALVFLDAAAPATSLGAFGSGLGFGGLPGAAVTLDTYTSAGDPSSNFVGLATGGDVNGLTYIDATTLEDELTGGPKKVTVVHSNGTLRVLVDGTTVMESPTTLPSTALIGFTAGTGGLSNRHRVSDVVITAVTTTGPAVIDATPVLTDYGSIAIGESVSRSITLTNTGGQPLAITGFGPMTAPFVLESANPTGSTLNPGQSLVVGVRFQPTSVGLDTFDLPITTTAGNDTVNLRGEGLAAMVATGTILSPQPTLAWAVGDDVVFEGSAVDAAGGPLTAAAMSWEVDLHHCETIDDCHTHPLTTFEGIASGSFEAPDHEYPSYLSLTLNVTDGATSSDSSVDLFPATSLITVETSPPGGDVIVWGVTETTPITVEAIVGSILDLQALPQYTIGTDTLDFAFWSNGGSALQSYVTPAADATLVASYEGGPTEVVPPPSAGGWQFNGAAALTGDALDLTPVANFSVGSAFWPTAVATEGLSVSFTADILDGSGADGLTLAILDPAESPTSIGAGGSGMGFSGLTGVAIALDTYQSPGDPSGNFIGLSTGGTAAGLTYLATNAAIPELTGVPHDIEVTYSGGDLTVRMDGVVVLSETVALSPTALIGFTAATGGLNNRHSVTNVAISTGGTPPPSPPIPIITEPSTSTTWQAGMPITFTGFATTQAGTPLAAASLSWTVELVTCDPTCTTEPLTELLGVASGSVDGPDRYDAGHLVVTLTAADQGVAASTTIDIYPETADLTFATNPAGLDIMVAGVAGISPTSVTAVVGSTINVAAAQSQPGYTFDSWSDGGAADHDVTVPIDDSMFIASYTGAGGGTIPPPSDGGWQLNGDALMVGDVLRLTAAAGGQAGSAFWPVPTDTDALTISFVAQLDGGSGADGMTFSLLDVADPATAVGANGSGLGFGGLTGVAVSLDTFQSPGDPSGNFVGLATSGNGDGLVYTTTGVPTGDLTGAPRSVTITIANGILEVSIDGQEVLSSSVTLPPMARVGFTAGTGGAFNAHDVSNVVITSGGVVPGSDPALLVVSETALDLGSVAPGSTGSLDLTVSNGGDLDLTLTSAATDNGLFGVTPDPAGVVLAGGESTVLSVSYNPTDVGSDAATLTIVSSAGTELVVLTGSSSDPGQTNLPVVDLLEPQADDLLQCTITLQTHATDQPGPLGPIGAVRQIEWWLYHPSFVEQHPGNAESKVLLALVPGPEADDIYEATWVFQNPYTPDHDGDHDGDHGGGDGTRTYILPNDGRPFELQSYGIDDEWNAAPGAPGFSQMIEVQPDFDCVPLQIDLSDIALGATPVGSPVSSSVTVRNTGATDITVGEMSATGGFAVSGPATIPAGGSITVDIGYSPTGPGPAEGLLTILGSDGAGTPLVDTAVLTAQGTSDVVDPLSAGGWSINGSAQQLAGVTSLTDGSFQAGSAIWPLAVSTDRMTIAVSAEIVPGLNRGDGFAVLLLDPTESPSSVGAIGSGLGYGGLTGLAIVFDTYQSPGDPGGNFVGIATSGDDSGLLYVDTVPIGVDLRDRVLDIRIEVFVDRIEVWLNGTMVLQATVTAPTDALVGLSAGTGGSDDGHSILDATVSQRSIL